MCILPQEKMANYVIHFLRKKRRKGGGEKKEEKENKKNPNSNTLRPSLERRHVSALVDQPS